MKVSHLTIQRYKSVIEPLQLTFDPSLTVFIGKNNSGKSNILDALYTFCRPMHDPTRFHDPEGRFSITCLLSEKDRAELSKMGFSFGEKLVLLFENDSLMVKTEDEVQKADPRLLQWMYDASVRVSALRDLDYVKMKKLFDEFKSGWPKVFKLFIAELHEFFPEIKAPTKLFDDRAKGIDTYVKEFGESRAIERLGLGFQHIFILLLYFFHPRYDLICIDEPEIHLHPQMIKRLHDVLHTNKPQKQLFITTHSPLFIQPESLFHIIRTKHESKTGTHCYSIQKSEVNEQRLIQELNADNNEMFLADHVILVEGVSDRIFVRTLLERFYDQKIDIKVIPVHGKENFDIYVSLLKGFHIPYSLLVDSDAVQGQPISLIAKALAQAKDAGQDTLKKNHIFVIPGGSLESCYPRHFITENETKPLAALFVAQQLTKEEFVGPDVAPIKQLLDLVAKPLV